MATERSLGRGPKRADFRDTADVWSYIQMEFEEVLGRSIRDDETVTVVLVVSALSKLVRDQVAAD